MPSTSRRFRHRIMAGALMFWALSGFAVAAGDNGDDDHRLFAQAVQLGEKGQWQQASEMFSAIASRHPEWPEPKNNLAVAMLKLGKLNEAQQALEAAVTSQPSFRTAQANRKRLYDYLAAQAYERAIGNTENPPPPHLDLLDRVAQPVAKAEPVKPPVTLPAPVTPAAGPSETAIAEDIRKRLQVWSRAWSIGDVETYLASYSSHFDPEEDGTDYNQWRNVRRARLTLANNTQVVLQDIRVYLDADRRQAIAEFVQNYRSDRYQDKVVKQLLMANEKDHWLILSERVIEKLN